MGEQSHAAPAWLFVVAAWVALVVVLLGRVVGPTDLYHQTQPKTVSYTTDMLVNGQWVLPHDHLGELATKPPLYNWLAAPFVSLGGFSSELAHKAPSILALVGVCLVTFVLGGRIGRAEVGLGALAVTMLLGNYTIFKLGYLARPDMLLTLWLFVAWVSATAIFVRVRAGQLDGLMSLRIIFWSGVGLAWLTKGPAGLLPLLYGVIGARVICGKWKASGRLWWWGAVPALIPFLAWVSVVWVIDQSHLFDQLLWEETLGRMIGFGDETSDEGAHAWYLGAGHMLGYFFVRSVPWSILSCAAIVGLWGWWRTNGRHDAEPARHTGDMWMVGAGVWTILVVVVFTLSAGKRADYIAPAFPTGALLASWWWLRVAGASWRSTCVVLSVAALVVTGLIVNESRESAAPGPGYSRVIRSFVDDVTKRINMDDLPVYHRRLGTGHLPGVLGGPAPAEFERLAEHLRSGESFWLVEGSPTGDSGSFAQGPRFRDLGARFTLEIRSEPLARSAYWPGVVSLYRVDPEGEH